MDCIDLGEATELLMADEELIRLCELQKTGDEIFDVININETQHSDILGWLLDPREGHGQGDQILRDLLTAASMKFRTGESGLDGRLKTAAFCKDWPPSRIRTASFGSAFYARELGMRTSERVDLIIIDPHNEIIVLIENKTGTSHYKAQLEKYRASFIEMTKSHSHLTQYSHVYIALDRDFASDFNDADLPCANAWVHLGYEWLKSAASRALLQLERGNATAKLVMSYCNRQTDWESPEAKRCTELASSLHQRHPDAIKKLIDAYSSSIATQWLKTKSPDTEMLFILQNRSVIALLKETKGMASVKAELHRRLPNISHSSIEHARTWLSICPSGWEQLEGEWWPLFIHVRYSDKSKSKFDVSLVWRSEWVPVGVDAQAIRKRLAEVEPSFGSFGESRNRRVPIGAEFSLGELSKRIERLNLDLQRIAPSA